MSQKQLKKQLDAMQHHINFLQSQLSDIDAELSEQENKKNITRFDAEWWMGKPYWFLTVSGDAYFKDFFRGDDMDMGRLQIGNIYETEEEANKESERLKAKQRLRKAFDDFNGGWVPDWHCRSQRKYYLETNYMDDAPPLSWNCCYQSQGHENWEYLKDVPDQEFLNKIDADWKLFKEVE